MSALAINLSALVSAFAERAAPETATVLVCIRVLLVALLIALAIVPVATTATATASASACVVRQALLIVIVTALGSALLSVSATPRETAPATVTG